jgi:signal transduction histidine kinase
MEGVAVYSAVRARESLTLTAAIAIGGGLLRDLTDPLTVPPDLLFNPTLVGLAVAVGLVVRQIEDGRRAVASAEEATAAREAALAEAVIAEERLRIARELHDIVAHSLSVIVLQAGAAERSLEDAEKTAELLSSIRTTGTGAIEEMRSVLSVIESPEDGRAPLPTLADLGQLVERTRDAGLEVRLAVGDVTHALPTSLQLSAYRVVQESLANTLKHASATTATVTVNRSGDTLSVEVADDGRGGTHGTNPHHGLTGLAQRVAAFDGRFEAGPVDTGGWTVRAEFPVTP